MGKRVRAVLLAVLVYAAATVLIPLVERWAVGRTPDSALVGISIIVLLYLLPIVMLAVGSIWVARETREQDIVLPAVAWWLGWNLGNLITWTLIFNARGVELAARLIKPVTLGFLAPVDNAMSPLSLFTLGDMAFGLAMPWALIIIYASVFWNRGRTSGVVAPESSSRPQGAVTDTD